MVGSDALLGARSEAMVVVRNEDDGPPPVVVQDEAALVRDGLCLLLEQHGVEVVDAVASIDELADMPDRSFEVVLVSVESIEAASPGTVEALKAERSPLRVIAHGLDVSARRRSAAADQGCETVVDHADGIAATLAALRRETDGREPARDGADRGLITSRETEVLRLLGEGLTSREIAGHLSISPKTVENHKQRTFAKLGVQNKAHAISVAHRLGLLQAPRDRRRWA